MNVSREAVSFYVFGTPAPQGSKRFVGIAKKSGRGIMVESSAKVKPWREDVRLAAARVIADVLPHLRANLEAGGRNRLLQFPLDEPLRVRMTFTMPKPASAPKRRVTHPMRTPDLSKLVRSTEDALTSAGLWRDDARVVECLARKVYPGEHPESLSAPGVRITIEVMS